MKNFLNSLETKRAAMKEEGGFSLIDVVVTVAIIVALSVGGFIAYSGIVDNAKDAALTAAVDQVRTGIVVAENDSLSTTTAVTVRDGFNISSEGVDVALTNEDGVPAVDDAAALNATHITATNDDGGTKTVIRG